MSRTGTYWSDHNGRLNCAHGVLLHGTNCANCERGDIPDTLTPHERAAGPGPRNFVADALRAALAGKFSEGGFVPRTTGFDTASGPDYHVEVEMTRRRAGETYHFTVDDIKTSYEARSAMNGDEERLEAMQARMSAATRKIAEEIAERARRGEGWGGPYDTGKRWEHSRGDPRPRHQHCRSTINAVWGDGTPLTDDEADLINGRYRGGEIITDPNDTRGVNARRVGDRRYAAQS